MSTPKNKKGSFITFRPVKGTVKKVNDIIKANSPYPREPISTSQAIRIAIDQYHTKLKSSTTI